MKIVFLSIVSFIPIFIWDNSDYSKYSADVFFQIPEVQENVDPGAFDPGLLEAAVFFASQEMRESRNLPLYTFREDLRNSAAKHSMQMKTYNFLDHINRKNAAWRTPMKRIQAEGGKYFTVGENLALVNIYKLGSKGDYYLNKKNEAVDENGLPLKTYTYAELGRRIVSNWMNSPPHRENLLEKFNFLGIGSSPLSIKKGGLPQVYITQNFGNL